VRGYLRRFCDRFNNLEIRLDEAGIAKTYIEESGLLEPLVSWRLSDGTLKFLCLLAVLLDPAPAPLAVQIVAGALVEASERTQLIVTTHSEALIDALSERPEDVLVKQPGASILSAVLHLLQSRQVLWPHQEADGSRLPWFSFDEAVALQGFNHVVNGRRGNQEVALQIGLSRSLAVDLSVVVDEGEVLALFGGEGGCNGRIEFRRWVHRDLEGLLAKTVEDADLENANLAADNGAKGLFGRSGELPAQRLRVGAGACVIRDTDTHAASIGEDPFAAAFVLHSYRFSAE